MKIKKKKQLKKSYPKPYQVFAGFKIKFQQIQSPNGINFSSTDLNLPNFSSVSIHDKFDVFTLRTKIAFSIQKELTYKPKFLGY